jgi:hypothetical protein
VKEEVSGHFGDNFSGNTETNQGWLTGLDNFQRFFVCLIN